MLDLFKTLIADFHARGIQCRVIRRDLVVPLDADKVVSKAHRVKPDFSI